MSETPKPSRIACLQVPQWPLAARLRSEPWLRPEPLAIIGASGGAERVIAASRRARRSGVRVRQTLTAARACEPGLIVRPRDDACEDAAREALLDIAESFSPRVEDGGEGVVYLDVAAVPGCGGSGAELDLVHAWTVAAQTQAGLPVRVGFAAGKLAARLAASKPGPFCVVAAAEEAAFLAPAPLIRAALKPDLARALRRWGIHTFGDLAAVSEDRVAQRLGAAGEELRTVALGEDRRPLAARRPPAAFREGLALAEPLVGVTALAALAGGAVERLVKRLKAQGMGCVCLELALELEPGSSYRLSFPLPAPTHDLSTLTTMLRFEIESHPPRAAITGLAITAHPERPRGGQISLFGPPAVLPQELATALERLFATVGEDRVGSPRTADGCRPDRFHMAPFAPPKTTRGDAEPLPGLMTVRVLRPPVALEVMTDDAVAGSTTAPTPDFVKSRAEARQQRPRIQGRVRVASGPWTLTDGWWAQPPTARDYWDVELSCSGVYRIFRDRSDGEWFADGVYD